MYFDEISYSLCAPHVDESSLEDAFEIKDGYRFGDRSTLHITSAFLASLLSPKTFSQRLASKRSLTELYKDARKSEVRKKRMRQVVLHGRSWPGNRDVLQKDKSWHHVKTFLQSYNRDKVLLAWEEPLVGSLAGCLYGTTPTGIVANIDNTQETILNVKAGGKPAGVNACQIWVQDKFVSLAPDYPLVSHVFEANLQRHAWIEECRRSGRSVQVEMLIVYGNPSGQAVTLFKPYVCICMSVYNTGVKCAFVFAPTRTFTLLV